MSAIKRLMEEKNDLARETIKLRQENNRLKKLLYEYGEWARGNGERFRGNLQKNGEELFNQYLKERETWKSVR